MTESSYVTEGECDKKLEKVYKRMNAIENNVAKMFGGIAVVAFLSSFIVGFVSFHINQRFSGVEKAIEKMDNRIINYIHESN